MKAPADRKFHHAGAGSKGRALAAGSKADGKTEGKAGASKRLDAAAWTAAALAMLAETGIAGIRVELLAARLKVTKGSFYWHFRDRDALLVAMLEHWRRTATLELIERLDSDLASPRDRLSTLLKWSTRGRESRETAEVELSMRLWGRSDERARRALAEVDELRTRYISQLLGRCGIAAEETRARAVLIYSYIRVASTLIAPDDLALMAQCEQILLGDAAV